MDMVFGDVTCTTCMDDSKYQGWIGGWMQAMRMSYMSEGRGKKGRVLGGSCYCGILGERSAIPVLWVDSTELERSYNNIRDAKRVR